MKRLTAYALLLKAARYVKDRESFGCCELRSVVQDAGMGSYNLASEVPQFRDAMAAFDLFKCDGDENEGMTGWFGPPQNAECMAHRLTAMCMAAAIAKTRNGKCNRTE